MNGLQIEIKTHIKYLGLIIDRKLSFNEHINYIYKKCIKKIISLSSITRNTWGQSYETTKLIYKAAIEPIVLHRSSVWGQNINKTKINK